MSMTIPLEGAESTLYVDFNDVEDRVFLIVPLADDIQVARGTWIRLADSEGNECLGVVVEFNGEVARLRLDRSTWKTPATFEAIAKPWTGAVQTVSQAVASPSYQHA